MLQVSSITAIAVVGLLISLLIIFCGMGIFWAWRRIKLQNNSMFLLNQAQSMAQQRAATLQTWLQERMGLDQVTIDGIMAKHLEQEAQFFESMQDNMVEQNMATAQQLNQSFDQLQNLLKEIDLKLEPGQVTETQSAPEKTEQINQQSQTLTIEPAPLQETEPTSSELTKQTAESSITYSDDAPDIETPIPGVEPAPEATSAPLTEPPKTD